MKKPEQKFWNLIKDHLPGSLDRIENIVESGMPDVSACYKGNDYWVELKICQKKLCDVKKLHEPSQLSWHTRRVNAGSLIFVIVKHKKEIKIYIVKFTKELEYELIYTDPRYKNKYSWTDFTNVLITYL